MDSLTDEFVEVHYCSRKCCSSPNVDEEYASAPRGSGARLFVARNISVLPRNVSVAGSGEEKPITVGGKCVRWRKCCVKDRNTLTLLA